MEQPGKKTGLRIDAHLDEGLVAEVLAWLPAKYVLRFRAVCKRWLHIIDSPAFLAAHARCRPLELLVYTRREAEVVGPDGLPQAATELDLDAVAIAVPAHRPAAATRRTVATFPDSFDGGLNLYCSLLASCDGLLLIRDGARQQYLVFNPATWQWSDLPRLVVQQGSRAVPQESGFYFHHPSGEYRLLCHVSYEYDEFDAQAPHYCVLSTGAEEPRRLMSVQEATPMEEEIVVYDHWIPPKSRCFINLMTPAVLHGRLHWLHHMEAGLTDQMVAFDTVAETFRRMPPPPVTCKMHSHLLVADGSLMAAELGHLFMDFWFLEGYGGGAAKGTWEHRHRVDMRWPITGPLLVAGGDGEDVVLGHNQGVVAYNLRSRTFRQVVDVDESGDDPVLPSRYVFRESLVRHGFFQARRHPGLPSFRSCQ